MGDQNTAVAIPETQTMAIPDEQAFKAQLAAIRRFQAIAQQEMIKGHDYGVIPGTDKPSLLKPGAEKIIKILGLADTYETIVSQEDWKGGFFYYQIKCTLTTINGHIVSEGLGSCNSMESKYRWRWMFGSDIPEGVDKSNLYQAKRHSKKTGKDYIMYRLENDDIYGQVNTLLKMACKRAMVAAALSVGRLSDVFTQDIEDMATAAVAHDEGETEQPHDTIDKSTGQNVNTVEPPASLIDLPWLQESLKALKWTGAGTYLKEKYGVTAKSVSEAVSKLNAEQAKEFTAEIESRLKMK